MATAVTLNNGIKVPSLGLGTWLSKEGDVKDAIRTALDVGYRHIDSAVHYENEADIGEVLKEYFNSGKLKREDVFITSKLAAIYMGPSLVKTCLEQSLKNLQVSCIDLYLIHLPIAFKNRGDGTLWPRDENGGLELATCDLVDTWKQLEECVDEGKLKSIGVSNFNSEQVERICKNARIKPVTNQVECHAYLQQRDLQEFCNKYGIVLTAYAPIGSPGRPDQMKVSDEPILLQDPVVTDLAKKYNKTPVQVLLRNLLQRDMLVIPKSSNPSRIKENFQVFDFSISEEDMREIAKLDKKRRYFGMDKIANFKFHPEFPFSIPY